MPIFDQTEYIEQPLFRVIQGIQYVLRPAKPTIDHEPGLALLLSNGILQVYQWEIDAAGTHLTHVILPYSQVTLTAIRNSTDLQAALLELPRDVAQSDCDAARHRLSRIVAVCQTPELFNNQQLEVVEIGMLPPYHPLIIGLMSALFGAAGGVLAILNWRRLNHRRHAVVTGAITLVYVVIVAWLFLEYRRQLPPIVLLLNIGVGVGLALSQRKIYRRWRSSNRSTPLLASGLATLVLLIGTGVLFWMVAPRMVAPRPTLSPLVSSIASALTRTAPLALTPRPPRSTRPPQPTRTPLRVGLAFPTGWTLATSEVPDLGCINEGTQRCIWIAERTTQPATLVAYERRALLNLPDFAAMITDELLEQNPHQLARTFVTIEGEMDGYPAIRGIGYWCADTCTDYLLGIVAVNSYQHIVVVITAAQTDFTSLRGELNSLMESIHIIK